MCEYFPIKIRKDLTNLHRINNGLKLEIAKDLVVIYNGDASSESFKEIGRKLREIIRRKL